MTEKPIKPRKPKPRWGTREHDAKVENNRVRRVKKPEYVNGVNHGHG